MLFSDPLFLFFFLPILLLVYYASPHRLRNIVLSIASLAFYAMGEYRFVLWLLGSIAVNYWVAIGLDLVRGTRWSRPLLAAGIASDLALLLVFKYGDFGIANLNQVLGLMHVGPIGLPGLILPLGISFFTFHKISYKVDVYRGTAIVRRNPLDLALYILLFPQLIAGPIIRYHDIADQLIKRHTSRAMFAQGVRRFVIGLGKKMIIANTVALAADSIFAIPNSEVTVSTAWLGVICYALQIYFDFSGYSDMAIGLGHMFGFTFLENFNYPYISTSISEFWHRWHISLSRWFRDYLYIPLGGNRAGAGRTYFNLVTVFFLCGLWHGASWTFVIWGIYHGLFQIVERLGMARLLDALPKPFRHAYTLLVVLVGWVLFRADTLPEAWAVIRAMFGFAPLVSADYSLALFVNPELIIVMVLGVIGVGPIMPALVRWVEKTLPNLSDCVRPSFAFAATSAEFLLLAVIFVYSSMLMASGTYNPFIYFRF